MKRGLAVAAVVLALVAIVVSFMMGQGSDESRPELTHLVGRWVDTEAQGDVPTVVLHDNLRFTANNIPMAWFAPDGMAGDGLVDAEGRWAIRDAGHWVLALEPGNLPVDEVYIPIWLQGNYRLCVPVGREDDMADCHFLDRR